MKCIPVTPFSPAAHFQHHFPYRLKKGRQNLNGSKNLMTSGIRLEILSASRRNPVGIKKAPLLSLVWFPLANYLKR